MKRHHTFAASALAASILSFAALPAHASFLSCTGGAGASAFDLGARVSGDIGCTRLSTATNDTLGGASSNWTVNANAFFGASDWLFDGKWEGSSDASALYDFSATGQGGSFTRNLLPQGTRSAMFVFKSGQNTHLVAYLMDLNTTSGSFTTPFTEPPFDFPGAGNPRDISHLSVYYRLGASLPPQSTPIPEPSALALAGLALLGAGAAMRRRRG